MIKKILQISPYTFSHPGWVEQYARILQELFPDQMTTLSWGWDFPIAEPIHHCPLPCFWRRGFWDIFTQVSQENTSIIVSHIRFAPTAWLAFCIAKRKRIPYIHIEHGTGFLIHKNPIIAWGARIIDLTIGKYILRHAAKVVCISQAGKTWVSEAFGREEVVVIYRGFEFPKIERNKNEVSKIGFVGRLTWLKNIDGLIHILKEIASESWSCEIVWDGEEKEYLKKLSQDAWLTERIHFLGAKPHKWIIQEFYPTVDIFVNPSLQEWLPTTVIEALGMGCQVIATDVGGTREIDNIILISGEQLSGLKEELLSRLHQWNESIIVSTQFSLRNMQLWYTSIFDNLDTYA